MAIDISKIRLQSNKNHDHKRINRNSRTSIFQVQSNPFSLKVKHRFYSDLYVLLNAGLDIKAALVLMEDDMTTNKLKSHVIEVKLLVVEGQPLSSSMRAVFNIDQFEYYSLQIGEETGEIENILNQLSAYFESRINQKRQMISALSYPLIVLLTAICAVAFMLQIVVPLFEDVFNRFGKELPALTQFVIKSSEISKILFPWFIGLIVLSIAIFPLIKRNKIYKKYSSIIILNTPVFGPFVQKALLLRLASSLELLLGSNTNLLRSIELAEKMTTFYPLSIALIDVQKELKEGKSLVFAMEKHKIFTKRFITLIRVGEEVNHLTASCSQLRKQFEKELDVFSNTLGQILEPMIILFIGFFVGVIIIAMYLPMFELSTLF